MAQKKTLTKFVNSETIVTADFANRVFGGLYGTDEGSGLDPNDPLVAGHVHDGKHEDGHAPKVDLVNHVTGQIENQNIADRAVNVRNVERYTNPALAIPVSEVISGTTYYYIDPSTLPSGGGGGVDPLLLENIRNFIGMDSPAPIMPTYTDYVPSLNFVTDGQSLEEAIATLDNSIVGLGNHASTHIAGASDEIDGDKLDIDFVPTAYTRTVTPTLTTVNNELTSHLAGIDAAIDDLQNNTGAHAPTHILGGADEIEGDKLSVVFSPSNYSPSIVSPATHVDHLTAHLAGLDSIIGSIMSAPVANHASSHLSGGSDEVDGDRLDIDYVPSNYTRNTAPAQVTLTAHLTAHLAGIDDALGNTSLHAATHLAGGADEIDADKLDIDFVPDNYVREVTTQTTLVNELTSHLKGIDTAIGDIADLSSHAATHIHDGTDEIDGDKLDINYVPSHYTRNTTPSEVTSVEELTAHLAGIDTVLGDISSNLTPHAATHISGASDEIDGDKLDIDYVPSHYTRSTVPSEVTTVAELTAHLAGIDTVLGDISSNLTPHAATHISGASDEIDGDQIDIDFVPSNYSRDTSPAQVSLAEHLTAHLKGLDNAVGNVITHGSRHIRGGSDEIDGDKLDIDFDPSHYTPLTTPTQVTHVDELSAHLAGIDDAIGVLSNAPTTQHASTHIRAGSDEIDGDKLDIDFNPANYTPTTNALAPHVDDLSAHLGGIDLAFAGKANVSHAALHIRGGADVIDADLLDVSYNPTNYTPAATAPATHIDHLAAHLIGINTAFAGKANVTHAATHISGGTDEIDGDQLDIDYTPVNYVRTTSPTQVSHIEHLTAHLAGIDNALAGSGVSTHASTHYEGSSDEILGDRIHIDFTPAFYTPITSTGLSLTTTELAAHLVGIDNKFEVVADDSLNHSARHIRGGGDQIVGDRLDITYNPANYTPVATAPATHIDELAAHLIGINNAFAAKASTSHAATHIRAGSDAIDADLLDISYDPTNYTPAATAPATHIDHLAAHLIGINAAFATKANISHGATHIRGGTAEIDGDRLDIDYVPVNYIRTTVPTQVNHVENLTSHLAGIDNALAGSGVSTHASTHYEGSSDEILGDRIHLNYTPEFYTPIHHAPLTLSETELGAHLRGLDAMFEGINYDTIYDWGNDTYADKLHAYSHTRIGNDPIEGDLLDISYSPTNYTPVATLPATHTRDLAAHLIGINTAIGTKANVSHGATHIRGGTAEIDGDRLDIDYVPVNYVRTTTPTQVNHVENLTSHLAGIDLALASSGMSNHASTHVRGGADILDGDLIDISYNPTNYVPTVSAPATNVDDLAAHLIGINLELGLKASSTHAPTHIRGGSDVIDADLLDITYNPTNYTPAATAPATHIDHLAAHLIGINTALGLKASTTHAATHIRGGSDVLDGDLIDITYNPTNYTPAATTPATHIDHLAAHLIGINTALGARASTTHAPTHIRGGSDVIDADLLDISYAAVNFTPTATAPATHVNHLTAYLAGIDTAFTTKANISHGTTHIRGGSAEIDGDRLDVDYVPTNYSRSTAPAQVTSVEHLTAHLAGIDLALAGSGVSTHASTHYEGSSDEILGDRIHIDFTPAFYNPIASTGASLTTTELAAHLVGIDNKFEVVAEDSLNHSARHIRGGGDQIDGDRLDITYNPANYTPTVTAPATHIDDLAAHLVGINNAFATKANISHGASHIRGGTSEIDGDQLDIDYVPTNYTRTTAPTQVSHIEHLTAHLAGIDNKIAQITPIFTRSSTTVSNGGGTYASDNFVFGSTSLTHVANANYYNRMLFSKSTGAFRAGRVTSTQWNTMPEGSAAFGVNNIAAGKRSFTAGFNNVIQNGAKIEANNTAAFNEGNISEHSNVFLHGTSGKSMASQSRVFGSGEYNQTLNTTFGLTGLQGPGSATYHEFVIHGECYLQSGIHAADISPGDIPTGGCFYIENQTSALVLVEGMITRYSTSSSSSFVYPVNSYTFVNRYSSGFQGIDNGESPNPSGNRIDLSSVTGGLQFFNPFFIATHRYNGSSTIAQLDPGLFYIRGITDQNAATNRMRYFVRVKIYNFTLGCDVERSK